MYVEEHPVSVKRINEVRQISHLGVVMVEGREKGVRVRKEEKIRGKRRGEI